MTSYTPRDVQVVRDVAGGCRLLVAATARAVADLKQVGAAVV